MLSKLINRIVPIMTHPVKTGFGKYCGLGSRCGSDGSMSLPTPEIRGLDTVGKIYIEDFLSTV